MLSKTIQELIEAIKQHDDQKKERILKTLERSGMDRYSAMIVAKEMMKEKLDEH